MVDDFADAVGTESFVEPDRGLILGHDIQRNGAPTLVGVFERCGHQATSHPGRAIGGVDEESDDDRESSR